MVITNLIKALKKKVLDANLKLYKSNLAISTFGNVSEKIIYKNKSYIAIKPSGIQYDEIKIQDIAILDQDGNLLEGDKKPSTDTETHLYLYNSIQRIRGICHNHSIYSCAWSQSGKNIPVLGTTHADYSNKPIYCTTSLTPKQIKKNYEKNTGIEIIKTLKKKNNLNANMILSKHHGPFAFGKDSYDAVSNIIILEAIAQIAYLTVNINLHVKNISKTLSNKHYNRKNGLNSYYGQN